MINDRFSIGLIGFIGGIIGAIIINYFTYLLQKKYENKEEIKIYKEELIESLVEFCNIWDNSNPSIYYHPDAIFQMKIEMHKFLREFTKKTSKKHSCILTNNINGELRELCTSLTDRLPFITEESVDGGFVEEDFNEMSRKATNIINELENV